MENKEQGDYLYKTTRFKGRYPSIPKENPPIKVRKVRNYSTQNFWTPVSQTKRNYSNSNCVNGTYQIPANIHPSQRYIRTVKKVLKRSRQNQDLNINSVKRNRIKSHRIASNPIKYQTNAAKIHRFHRITQKEIYSS